jgi:hypothetical protein
MHRTHEESQNSPWYTYTYTVTNVTNVTMLIFIGLLA